MIDTNLRQNGVDLDEIFLKKDEDYLLPNYLRSGSLFLWGDNFYGPLGSGTSGGSRNSPVQLSGGNWYEISKGSVNYESSGIIKADGTLWVWGWNTDGKLGLGDVTHRSSPIQRGSQTNWKSISLSTYSSISLDRAGFLYASGRNSNGELGLNDTIARSSPVQLSSGGGWNKIMSGEGFNFAIRNDGTLWGWGENSNGNLGQNNTISYSSPVQIGTDNNWDDVSAGTYHVIARKTNGTMWTWGQNSGGALGLNNIIDYSSPVQVGSSSDWWKISAGGSSYSIALKTNGTLWAWGDNFYGNLGQNNTVYYSSPVQIGALSDWWKISAGGGRFILAIKTNGSLWSWGYNLYGMLGTGNTTNRSSPVQVGTLLNWSKIGTGNFNSYAITF